MWDGLTEICRRESLTANQLVTLVDRCRYRSTLTAKLRVFILAYFRKATTEAGHAEAGHGREMTAAPRANRRRVRRRSGAGANAPDTIYHAVYAEMGKIETRRSDG